MKFQREVLEQPERETVVILSQLIMRSDKQEGTSFTTSPRKRNGLLSEQQQKAKGGYRDILLLLNLFQ
jgi:hypothetical protein